MITPIAGSADVPALRDLDLGESLLARLSPMLPMLPTGVLLSQLASGELVRIDARFAGLARKSSGARIGQIKDAGRVARLVEITNPSAMATGALIVFQIITVVVGQQHLSSIGERLRFLGDGLARLDAHFKHEKVAILQAAYEQLFVIAQPVVLGEWDSDYLGQLSSIERKLNEVGQFAHNALRAEQERLEHAELRSFSSARKAVSPLDRHAVEIDYLLQLWAQSLDARIIALQILALCPELSTQRFLALDMILRAGAEKYAATAKEAYSIGLLAVGRVETVVPLAKRRLGQVTVSALQNIRRVRDFAAEMAEEHRAQLRAAGTAHQASREGVTLYATRTSDGAIRYLVPKSSSV